MRRRSIASGVAKNFQKRVSYSATQGMNVLLFGEKNKRGTRGASTFNNKNKNKK